MDFELEIDEKEKDGMELVIDGLTITIPEHLVEERINLTGMQKEEIKEHLIESGQTLKKCWLKNNTYNPSTFEKKYIDWLDNEMSIYRPR